VTDDEIATLERTLLEAGETVVVPTDVMRRWLRRHRLALEAEARLDGYAQRIADVSMLNLDDTLLPDGSF